MLLGKTFFRGEVDLWWAVAPLNCAAHTGGLTETRTRVDVLQKTVATKICTSGLKSEDNVSNFQGCRKLEDG